MKALLAAALLALAACNVNDYCLNCAKGDGGGSGDGSGSDGSGSDGSGSDGSGACVPTGPEICDGKDNDCNGQVDDNPVDANQPCANQMGACAGGVTVCDQGTLKCTKNPSPEVCDGIDNNCDGQIDDGDPGGGGFCGSGVGDCMKGVNHCINGTVQCFGAVGPQPEVCDARDNDCDGNFDEGLTNLGTCGTSNVGQCHFGTLMCQGGATVCVGAQGPLFEVCNNVDDDCDGMVDEGYDTQTDPQNCGSCGNVCNLPHANAACSAGGCVIGSCQAGYHDNNGIAADGCEFGPCFISGVEVCDGVDNDCDGNVDEDVGTPPAICATQGECAGTVASCQGAGGWVCNYGSTVSTDGMGNIIPETSCDGLDNDCNGTIDDHQPNKGQACDDGKLGACKGTGSFTCDPNNLNGPAICTITTMGASPQPESCNNLDDDCDGVVDNPTTPGVYPAASPGLEWIDIGGGHQMMKYEASKPDAIATDEGNVVTTDCGATSTVAAGGATESGTTATVTTTAAHGLLAGKVVVISGVGVAGYNGTFAVASIVSPTRFTVTAPAGLGTSGNGTVKPVCPTCSQATKIPWTNVTYPQALAACQAVGATLCTEQQWHRTCSVIAPTTYPIVLPSTGTITQVVEAEDYFAITSAVDSTEVNPPGPTSHAWVEDYSPGFSGISNMQAIPDNGSNIANGSVIGNAPHLDFQFNFQKASTYKIWALINSPNTNANRIAVTIDNAVIGNNNRITTTANNAWQWIQAVQTFTLTAGIHTVQVYMVKDGVRIDAIEVTDGNATPTGPGNPAGHEWAYATNPDTYQPTTCNGHDFDATQDATIPTGSLANCYANDAAASHAFDMSGNVKEWTLARQPGENPIRGGSSNNTDIGISCPLNFTLADDTFFITNVGFRCCR